MRVLERPVQMAGLDMLSEKKPAYQIRPSNGRSETRPWDLAGSALLVGYTLEMRLPRARGLGRLSPQVQHDHLQPWSPSQERWLRLEEAEIKDPKG